MNKRYYDRKATRKLLDQPVSLPEVTSIQFDVHDSKVNDAGYAQPPHEDGIDRVIKISPWGEPFITLLIEYMLCPRDFDNIRSMKQRELAQMIRDMGAERVSCGDNTKSGRFVSIDDVIIT